MRYNTVMSISNISSWGSFIDCSSPCAPVVDLYDYIVELIVRIVAFVKKCFNDLGDFLFLPCPRSLSAHPKKSRRKYVPERPRPLVIRPRELNPELRSMYVGNDELLETHVEKAQALQLLPPALFSYKLDRTIFLNENYRRSLFQLLDDFFICASLAPCIFRFIETFTENLLQTEIGEAHQRHLGTLIGVEGAEQISHPSGVVTFLLCGYTASPYSGDKVLHLMVHLPHMDRNTLMRLTSRILLSFPSLENHFQILPTDWSRESTTGAWSLPIIGSINSPAPLPKLEERLYPQPLFSNAYSLIIGGALCPYFHGDREQFERQLLEFFESHVSSLPAEDIDPIIESLWKFVTALTLDLRKRFDIPQRATMPIYFSISPQASGTVFHIQTGFNIDNDGDYAVLQALLRNSFFKQCYLREKSHLMRHFLVSTPWEIARRNHGVGYTGQFSLHLRHRLNNFNDSDLNAQNLVFFSMEKKNATNHPEIVEQFLNEAYRLRGIERGAIDQFWVRVRQYEEEDTHETTWLEYALIDLREDQEIIAEGSAHFEQERLLGQNLPQGFTFHQFDPRPSLEGALYDQNVFNLERVRYCARYRFT